MRPDSSKSKDTPGSLDSATPRSSDIRRRLRRIDLGLPHCSRPMARVAAAGSGAGDSRSSAADSGSVARPTQSGSLTRRAAVTAAIQQTTTSNVDERPRHSSGDVVPPVEADGPSATRGGEQRRTTDSVDSQPLRGSDDNGDLRATRPDSPGQRQVTRTGADGDPACLARPAMAQRQLTFTQQRRPPTTTRPVTTSKSAKTAGATTMCKSVTHPSFLAMLVSGTAVAGRDAAGVRGHVTARTPNTRQADSNAESTTNNDDNNNNNEDDDDDDEMKRQRIEDWLQHLENVVLDRPASPVIDDDVPLQTDTAIHIVYDGD